MELQSDRLRSDRTNWREVADRCASSWFRNLRGAAIVLGGSILDADELLADAIEKLLQAWERGAGPDDGFEGYLMRSMRNRVIDEARSPRSRAVTYDEAVLPTLPNGGSRMDSPFDAALVRGEMRAQITAALHALPPATQEVLIESCIHHRQPAELAQEWGISANAAAQRTSRARQDLRAAYMRITAGDTARTRTDETRLLAA